jgi:8-amino-7-oxononanoate synthase
MPSWFQDELDALREQDLHRTRRRLQSASGPRIRFRGRELVNFASNDYLGLAADPRLGRAAARAARKYGTGAGASPLVAGYLPPLRRLERRLARWEQAEESLVFASGFAANLGTITSLVGAGDAVFSDALNHASLIDGCRLSRAAIHVYRHADVYHLQELLARHGSTAQRRLIITDSVFSMDGDIAPLPALLELALEHDCLLLVDEAHATGVLGEHGRGATELTRVESDPDRIIKIGTLSKALGAQGGFVAGSRLMVDWLVNRARPYIFSTALAPPAAAAACQAVKLVALEPERRRRVLALAEFLKKELRRLDFPESQSQCQIVPILVGEARAAVELSRRLEARGLLVPAIRPPSVPEKTARLRISLTAGHCEEDVARLIEVLHACYPPLRGARHAYR